MEDVVQSMSLNLVAVLSANAVVVMYHQKILTVALTVELKTKHERLRNN